MSTSSAEPTTPFGRDLLVAAGLAAGPLVGIGLARFAYGAAASGDAR